MCAKNFPPETHKCYMMPETSDFEEERVSTEEEFENAKTFIFFDFECTQDDFIECDMKYNPDLFLENANLFEVRLWCIRTQTKSLCRTQNMYSVYG